jgi:glycosyltransferase involved in cell wall biosynthesis
MADAFPGARAAYGFVYFGKCTGKERFLGSTPPIRIIPGILKMLLPVSAFIVCKDEESYIEGCISSLSMCAEIVVVDSGSTDKTIEIIKNLEGKDLPVRLMVEPWRGYGAQKQFALDNCTQEWCLSIDSDERVSAKLRNALPGLVSRADVDAWKLTRYDYLPGFGYVPPELHERFHVRLFRRGSGAFNPSDRVHECIKVNGRVKKAMQGGLLHFRPVPLSEQILKENRYSTLKAEMKGERGIRSRPFKMIVSPPVFFLRWYFRYGLWKCGWPGFIRAANGSIYSYLTEAKRYEAEALRHVPPIEPGDPVGY